MPDLRSRASELPPLPGVYLYKDAHGTVIYVGKAKNLRNRVRSYFSDERLADRKTGTLVSEASTIDFIEVDNEKEALALENNLIKQWKPRYNILLRDDKTYPYIKLTAEKYPRVYVTRRLKKDGSTYFGPYFPGNLAHRLVSFIHRHFLVPSCKIDFSRKHTHPCLEYHIHRCLGPCVAGLTTDEQYAEAVRAVRFFLEGRHKDLVDELQTKMELASTAMRYEQAASLFELIRTVQEMGEKQKMAAAEGADTDIIAYYAEPPLVAVNLFHLRHGHIVDRREFFWEDQREFEPSEFVSSLLKQVYLDEPYVPAFIHVTADFEDCEALEELLSEKRKRKVEIHTPQRGQKKAMQELAESNAKHSFEQRFRIMKPSSDAIKKALEDALGLEEAPDRIECFDISHIQGTDKVASMVVWEDGRMKKADYRKFVIRTVAGNDDFASMREVITRRYGRLQAEAQSSKLIHITEQGDDLPDEISGDARRDDVPPELALSVEAVPPLSRLDVMKKTLVLVDGGLGQLHAAAQALESLGITNQPLASIAKREEWIYVYGQEEEPVVLDKFSPVLHLVQQIRDEAHRFAVTFHRTRRNASRLRSELDQIAGVGEKTVMKLLQHFGSVERVRQASEEELARVTGRVAAQKIAAGLTKESASPVSSENLV